jgi:nitroreductase
VDDSYRLIRGLRAVRAFRPDPIDEAVLAAVLDAARWTGSSKNSQRWAVVLVTDPEQKERLAAAGRYAVPVLAAPAAVALVRLPGGNDFDVGRLAQNLMLGAATQGLASCPVTLHDETLAREVLGVPSDHGARYAVALGYPTEEPPRPFAGGGRKPMAEFVRGERFTQ